MYCQKAYQFTFCKKILLCELGPGDDDEDEMKMILTKDDYDGVLFMRMYQFYAGVIISISIEIIFFS